MAAGTYLGWTILPTHPGKIGAAIRLAAEQGLPDIYFLLINLNRGRKAAAYGDSPWPHIEAEATAAAIEKYVESVAALIGEWERDALPN